MILSFIITAALLLAGAILVWLFFVKTGERRSDLRRIQTEQYNTVFLSMFPIDNYTEDSFAYWRGQFALKASYEIPDLKVMQEYFKEIASSGNEISTIYLGVCPEKISPDSLLDLLREYPSVTYHIILPYASIDYWNALPETSVDEKITAYRSFADALLPESNISLYLFSREWLICNPANYEDAFLTNEGISLNLMLNCDRDHHYLLTPDNIEDVFQSFTQLLTEKRGVQGSYADFSGQKIVFFGDSVIGNYTDSSSIPGVVHGLTGASVYNCGYGGNAAAKGPEDMVSLPEIINAFVQKDLSVIPEEEQIYLGMQEYLADTSAQKQLTFVINYGLNDYFNQYPVKNENPYDIYTYEGALRTAVSALREAYPDAQIVLATPNFTSYSADEGNRASGSRFTDYVNAVIAVAEEYHTLVLDNYTELGITLENHGEYLLDGVHPNEAARFTMGSRIAEALH